MSLLRRIWCALVGHRMKFNGGSPMCCRCGWRPPGSGRLILSATEGKP